LPVPAFVYCDGFLSWGRVQRSPQSVAAPRFRDELATLARDAAPGSRLVTGLRRSYGDSGLNGFGRVIDATQIDRFISFDGSSGRLRAEAGASLSQILSLCAPRGWFLATTPGTRFVTLGGAVANDVHGKNHHGAGSFGASVLSFGLARSDGRRLAVSRESDPGLFEATIGGLGLTGAIEWVEIALAKISSAYLDVETLAFGSLGEFWALTRESVDKFEHTVSWIDCGARGANFGRGLFSRANWRDDGDFTAHDDRSWKTIPCDAPALLLNRASVAAFNEAYYRAGKSKAGLARRHYAPFFYPLDAIRNWNRLYGARGMRQYQCVVPPDCARDAIARLLDEITRSGQASFLAVLKTFGDRACAGLLSFPRPGATLALDFPNRGAETLRLMARLDAIVLEAGGALYPAKDGRMPAALFRRSFPRWQDFLDYKDPGMNSDFWRRVAE